MIYNKTALLLEVKLSDVVDWETDDEWGKKFTQVVKLEDLARHKVKLGGSISTQHHIFLPDFFIKDIDKLANIQKFALHVAKKDGEVKLTVRPGFGIEGWATFPYAIEKNMSLPYYAKSMADQLRDDGGILVEIDGIPVSEVAEIDVGESLGKEREEDILDIRQAIPTWLQDLTDFIEENKKRINPRFAKWPFPGNFVLSGNGAVMLLSKRPGEGAYIIRDYIEGSDWQKAVRDKYVEFGRSAAGRAGAAEKSRRAAERQQEQAAAAAITGQAVMAPPMPKEVPVEKQLKLQLRDWLYENDYGFMLRRDVHADQIKEMIKNDFSYDDAKKYGEMKVERLKKESFEELLDDLLCLND